MKKDLESCLLIPRKGAAFAAEIAARNDIQKAMEQGMQRANIMIKGASVGGYAALRAIL